MRFEVKNGSDFSSSEIEKMIDLHHLIFSKQRSPIRLFRTTEELRELIKHNKCISILMYDQTQEILGFMIVFPTIHEFVDDLVPWVDFDFYRKELRGIPWYISAITVKPSQQKNNYGKDLMLYFRDWLHKNNIKIISFDCNTFYSGFLPIVVGNLEHRPHLLFPNIKIAEQLSIAGMQGLHSNPAWFYCLDESYYPLLTNAFKHSEEA